MTETTTAIRPARDYNTKRTRERLMEGCVRVWFSDPSVWVLSFFLALRHRVVRRKKRKGRGMKSQKGRGITPSVCLPCRLLQQPSENPDIHTPPLLFSPLTGCVCVWISSLYTHTQTVEQNSERLLSLQFRNVFSH